MAQDDGDMIKIALSENRILLTRDTRVMKRRVVISGKMKAVFLEDDDPRMQLRKAVDSCHRIYWQGTHWTAMSKEIERLISE
jgi:uncharacterized protein with PIN domain